MTESCKDEPRLCSTSTSTLAPNIPTREQMLNHFSHFSACLSGLFEETDKICKLPTGIQLDLSLDNYDLDLHRHLPTGNSNQTAKYCTTAPKNVILQSWPVDERIRSLEHLCQQLLLLEARHRLITALNNLLRPFWNLGSAALSLWRRYISMHHKSTFDILKITTCERNWSHFSKVCVCFVCLSADGRSESSGCAVWGPWACSTRPSRPQMWHFGPYLIFDLLFKASWQPRVQYFNLTDWRQVFMLHNQRDESPEGELCTVWLLC